MDRVPLHEAATGDVLIMKFGAGPQHFGIVSRTDPLYVIHALAQVGRVCEARVNANWPYRAYRFRC